VASTRGKCEKYGEVSLERKKGGGELGGPSAWGKKKEKGGAIKGENKLGRSKDTILWMGVGTNGFDKEETLPAYREWERGKPLKAGKWGGKERSPRKGGKTYTRKRGETHGKAKPAWVNLGKGEKKAFKGKDGAAK